MISAAIKANQLLAIGDVDANPFFSGYE